MLILFYVTCTRQAGSSERSHHGLNYVCLLIILASSNHDLRGRAAETDLARFMSRLELQTLHHALTLYTY